MNPQRWSDVLLLGAAAISLIIVTQIWVRHHRVSKARQRHPSAPPAVIVRLHSTGSDARWVVSTHGLSPRTSLDIFTWRPANTSSPWFSEPIIAPIVLEPGISMTLDSPIVDPTLPHDVVLAWTQHRPEGDLEGSRTVIIEPSTGSAAVTSEPNERGIPWWPLVASAALVAVFVIALVVRGRPFDGERSSQITTAPPTNATTTVPTTSVTTALGPAKAPSTASSSTAVPTPSTEVAAATSSPLSESSTSAPPSSTAGATIPPTSTSIVSFVTEDDGRVISLVAESGQCRFGDRCLILGFTLRGFANEGEYVCEFGDGSRYVFRYVGDGADNACATSGPSITIEVDGVRTQTITRELLNEG